MTSTTILRGFTTLLETSVDLLYANHLYEKNFSIERGRVLASIARDWVLTISEKVEAGLPPTFDETIKVA